MIAPEKRVSKNVWLSVIIMGFFAQIAWTVENFYMNLFLYKTITEDPNAIAIRVAATAIAGTITTLLVGPLSDKLGKRKIFMTIGYICWGFVIMMFAHVSVDNTTLIFANRDLLQLISITVAIVVILDCIKTFFGSMANDAAFNAWVTDVVSETNRGKVEAVIVALPMIAMLLVFGVGDPIVQNDRWDLFFYILGGMVVLSGIAGIFLLKDKCVKRENTSYLHDVVYGFRLPVIRARKSLYTVFLAILIFSTANNIFMPYLIIYIENFLQIKDYAIMMGIVLIIASSGIVFLGRMVDKYGKHKFLFPSTFVFFMGCMLMYITGKVGIHNILSPLWLMIFAIIFGSILIGGGLLLMLILVALARDKMPETQRGHFNGIRMIFFVMLPMVIGPFIGSNIIKASESTFVDEFGIVQSVPIPEIFLAASLVSLLIIIPTASIYRSLKNNLPNEKLYTPWGRELNKTKPLPEYPRPQLMRDSYINLNGPWEYAIYDKSEDFKGYQGEIIVPFSPETILSGVDREVTPSDYLYYNKEFVVASEFLKEKSILHFGAVDCYCDVYLNDEHLGAHAGGFLPFYFDVTVAIKQGVNVLTLRVSDPTDTSYVSRGKQALKRGGIWYTPQSGIWQTVWLESVYDVYLEKLYLTPDIDNGTITIKPVISKTPESLRARILDNDKVILEKKLSANMDNVLKIEDIKLWSPETPHLYDLEITADHDVVKSYFGMRKFSMGIDEKGYKRIFLNNKPYFNNGVLDQGYWSDGMLTPPSDEAMRYDILKMKELGFNMLRKHIKVEPLRWYYHCDKLGMLVWQDMINGGEKYSIFTIGILPLLGCKLKDSQEKYRKFGRLNPRGREEYYKELEGMIDLLYNTVSINVWVPFNEGWGQFDANKAVDFVRERDTSRLIDHASGWHDQGGGDFNSPHIYFIKIKLPEDKNRAVALSEFGGYSYREEGHFFNKDRIFGYRIFKDKKSFINAYRKLYLEQVIPNISKGLSATVYTQVSDVEDEINGLLTYDREVLKINASDLADINAQIKL